jgi:hypothetical protein
MIIDSIFQLSFCSESYAMTIKVLVAAVPSQGFRDHPFLGLFWLWKPLHYLAYDCSLHV